MSRPSTRFAVRSRTRWPAWSRWRT